MKNSNSKFGILAAFAAAAVFSTAAFGQVWNESGDAPELLPGQACSGSGALTTINGSLQNGNDADLYEITVSDYTTFSATTVGLTTIDTTLFLFDSDGNGVAMDDDDPNGGGLQSTLSSAFLTHNGTYYIAVDNYNYKPQGAAGAIWVDGPFNVERAPDGPGAPGPLTAWGGSSFSTGTYGIGLTGCSFAGGGGGGYTLDISGTCPGSISISWSGATPNAQQAIAFGLNQGTTTIPNGPCAGTQLGIAGHVQQVGGLVPTGAQGSGSVNGNAPAFACGHYLQLVQGGSCATSNVAAIP